MLSVCKMLRGGRSGSRKSPPSRRPIMLFPDSTSMTAGLAVSPRHYVAGMPPHPKEHVNLKSIVLIAIGAVVLYAAYIGVSLFRLPPVEGLSNRSMNLTIQVKDWKGKDHPFIVGPKNSYWTPSESIPPEMTWAVIVAEDARFYQHEGIDVTAIRNAIRYDLEKKSFARGASTITQQVAKNLYLSREKSITRKIEEIVLAKRMEE